MNRRLQLWIIQQKKIKIKIFLGSINQDRQSLMHTLMISNH